MLCLFHAAKAEITCRSCQPGNKWRPRELLLKFDTSVSATGSKREVFGHGDGAGRIGTASAESRRLHCAAGSAECASDRAEDREPRQKRNTDNMRAKDDIGVNDTAKIKVSHLKMSGQKKSRDGAGFTNRHRKRARRSSGDGRVRTPVPAQSQAPGEDSSSAAGRRVKRSESRWSGEERRAAGQRQEEPKLNSSTFALTGDSSHNQAMVHWSGQNSSVLNTALLPASFQPSQSIRQYQNIEMHKPASFLGKTWSYVTHKKEEERETCKCALQTYWSFKMTDMHEKPFIFTLKYSPKYSATFSLSDRKFNTVFQLEHLQRNPPHTCLHTTSQNWENMLLLIICSIKDSTLWLQKGNVYVQSLVQLPVFLKQAVSSLHTLAHMENAASCILAVSDASHMQII
ncbi:VPS10 domain-containing receptor SorCS3 Precursor [Channa argus]|uniref:VPS10 domain-containing receptor SorCS3 n=1 Tax=Channa argus TaxID=215402 RepID=A0A6G1PA52_CHAAH|nr:VPS10 domain-containing receptor SorCS3 Precursor [Channa argus]